MAIKEHKAILRDFKGKTYQEALEWVKEGQGLFFTLSDDDIITMGGKQIHSASKNCDDAGAFALAAFLYILKNGSMKGLSEAYNLYAETLYWIKHKGIDDWFLTNVSHELYNWRYNLAYSQGSELEHYWSFDSNWRVPSWKERKKWVVSPPDDMTLDQMLSLGNFLIVISQGIYYINGEGSYTTSEMVGMFTSNSILDAVNESYPKAV